MTMPGGWSVHYETLKTFYGDVPQSCAGEPLPEQLAAARKKAERTLTMLGWDHASVTISADDHGVLSVSIS